MNLSPLLLEHFRHPRNVGRVADPTGRGRAENPACGDVVEVTARVTGDRVVAAAFLAEGCAALIGAASFVVERATGRTQAAVAALDADALLAEAGEPRAARRHGMQLALRALKAAVRAGA